MFTKKHMLVLSVLLILVLGTMSLGYGYWKETITVNGTVGTGVFDVKFGPMTPTDNEPSDVNYGTCTASRSPDYNNLTITIAHAYPGYTCTISGKLMNAGGVPIKLLNVTPTSTSSPIPPTWIHYNFSGTTLPDYGDIDGTVTVSIPEGETDHQNDTFSVDLALEFTQFNDETSVSNLD